MIRVRALGVLPDASGSTVNVSGVPALSSPNSGLSIGNSIVPELDISYFFTRNIAAELILGVTKHTITGTGTLNGLNIGSTWLLPPTLTLQYHFTDFGAFKPYVGAGVNYTVFYNQNAGNTPLNGVAVTGLSVGNSFGAVGQVGFEYMLDRHWGLNFDVKKLFLEPNYTATVNGATLAEGDTVTLIKDLKLKGSSTVLKRGTVIRGIHLTDDPAEIEGRTDKVKGLVLRTEFLKKA